MSSGGHIRWVFAALLAVALLALAACGGNDEDEATDAVEEALTSTDPSVCTDLQTEQYRQQIQLTMGEAALQGCQQELEFTAADSVEVTRVEVDGDTATVDVAYTGSAFDGQVITYELAKEGDQWKLDLLAGFAEFDRAAFARALDQVAREAEDVNPPGVECYNNQLKALSEQELEDLYTSGDFRKYAKLFQACN